MKVCVCVCVCVRERFRFMEEDWGGEERNKWMKGGSGWELRERENVQGNLQDR